MAQRFTPDEANALLPRLRPLLEALQRVVERLEQGQPRIAELEQAVRRNGHNAPTEPYAGQRAARSEARQLMQQIQALGAELKDPRSGLVDFRGLRDGVEVYLCWRLGEPEVAYWHPLDTGFAGRRPL